MLSKVLMVFALFILAYIVYITMNNEDKKCTTSSVVTTPKVEGASVKQQASASVATTVAQPVAQSVAQPTAPEQFTNMTINYENFANAEGIVDSAHNAAAFKNADEMTDGMYATVKYTGLADGSPNDVIQIEGTDLLTAPLVDNMLYTNSIANTNRNASQDLRGDIPLQFNETFTPFYSSTIYGAPLSQHTMTIGNA
jgi:hypothetical protein